MEGDKELKTFINLCLIAISSICYCYFIPTRIPHGVPRLLSLLPIVTAFIVLPLPISTVHLAFPAFFFLVWLANFKLLLFAFNRGPLSSEPRLPLLTFICIALLPINPKRIDQNLKSTNPVSSHNPIILTLKAVILIVIIHVYKYKVSLHWTVLTVLYFTHMHIGFELGFAITALLAKVLLGFGFKIEPQFNEPFLATSIQNFWGHRWNLVASSILRDTVYNPVRVISNRTLSMFWSQQLAIIVTFGVSGVMHELMFFYLMRVRPTWEVTWFFVVQGVCVAAEVAVKKAVEGRFRLHGMVAWVLGAAFLVVTGARLFFVQPVRNGLDAKIINECSILLKILGLSIGE